MQSRRNALRFWPDPLEMRVLSGGAGTRVADPAFSGHLTDGVSGRDRGIGPTQGLSVSRRVRGGGVDGKREKGGAQVQTDRRQVTVGLCGEGSQDVWGCFHPSSTALPDGATAGGPSERGPGWSAPSVLGEPAELVTGLLRSGS